MNIAAGLYAPESGSLFIDDNPVRLSGPRDASRYRIGMVHQHFKLVKPFSVAENILLGLPEQPGNAVRGSHRQRLRALEARIGEKAAELASPSTPARPPNRSRWPNSSGWKSSRCCWPAPVS